MTFWHIYRKRIYLLTIFLILVGIPSAMIDFAIDEGTHSPTSLSGQMASAYVIFLRFPVVYFINKMGNDFGWFTPILFFGGFLLNAFIYSTIFFYVWDRFRKVKEMK